MGAVVDFFDGLRNVVANLGTARDKASHSVYAAPYVDQQELLNAYRGAWLPRKIVDIPALDACRNWRDWQAEADQITAIEAEETRLALRQKLLSAMTAARLFGGAAIYIGTDDADLMEPLDLDRMGLQSVRYLTVLTPKNLSGGPVEDDPSSEWFNRPSFWHMTGVRGELLRIHPSRLVILHGAKLPEGDPQAQSGWGDSILTATLDAVKKADSTSANIASLVFEAKVDVIRIPDMMANISDARYEEKILKRFSLAALGKGNNGTLILDKEEEYDQKKGQFQTLPEIMDRFFQNVSGAADIPMTRLFGQSPGGLNASGESDLRNYYDRIKAMQELDVTPAMWRLDEALIRSALGTRPPEIHYNWTPLWQLGEKERAEIGKVTADTAEALSRAQLFAPEALAEATGNSLVEIGALPGLEAAMERFGMFDPAELDELDEARPPRARPVVDAAPRSLYVHRKVLNGEEIVRWAKQQGFRTTLPAEDLHVTIAFSREPVDWMEVGNSWEPRLDVPAGGPRLMEQFGEARVLLFSSDDLQWRHQRIREVGASWDHPEYQPHITISYDPEAPDLASVEPYQGPIILGPEIFAEVDEDWQSRVSEE